MEKNGIYYIAIILLGWVFIGIEYKIISFIVKKTGLHLKLHRPLEVVVLIIMEILGAIYVFTYFSVLSPVYLVILLAILLTKITGLWTLKKWVLLAYVIPVIALQFVDITNFNFKLDLTTALVGIISQSLIFLFYYLNVYHPNKNLFK